MPKFSREEYRRWSADSANSGLIKIFKPSLEIKFDSNTFTDDNAVDISVSIEDGTAFDRVDGMKGLDGKNYIIVEYLDIQRSDGGYYAIAMDMGPTGEC